MNTIPEMNRNRIERLIARFDGLGIDGMLLHDLTGVRYFSGFTGSHARLIVSRSRRILFTDQRYTEQAGMQAPGWEIATCGIDRFGDLVKTIADSAVKRLGFESDVVTVDEFEQLKKGLHTTSGSIELIPAAGLVIDIRAVKDAYEIACITKALGIAEQALTEMVKEIKPGMTEKAIAVRLEELMQQQGSEMPAFPTIVACGTNTSKPHHAPGDDIVQAGDALLFDFGAQVGGYKSDITRMVYLGLEPEDFREIREVTEQALNAVEKVLKSGMTGAEADKVARDVFIDHNLESYTLRGLGHGVGLDIHEWPRLVMNSEMVLKPGMVATLEPGVYIPGKAGVRLENLARITEDGAEILNKIPLVLSMDSIQ